MDKYGAAGLLVESGIERTEGGLRCENFDPNSRVLQIQGPNAFKVMSAATNGAIDESLKYFSAGFFEIVGQRLYVSRTG